MALAAPLLASIGLTPIPGVSTTPCAVTRDRARELSTHATAAHLHPRSNRRWQHLHTAINAMQVLATPLVYSPVVALVRYHILEPALRHLISGKAEPRVDYSPHPTREWLKSH
jgi:hypothetical protein